MEASKALQRVKDIFHQLCVAVTGTSTTTEDEERAGEETGGRGRSGRGGRRGGRGRGGTTAGSKRQEIPTVFEDQSFQGGTKRGSGHMDNVMTQQLVDGDAVYCEDAFANILAAGIRPDLSMYKAMLTVLWYESQLPVVVVREGG